MDPAILGEFINEILIKSGLLGSDRSFVEGLTPRQVHIIMEIGTSVFRHGDLAARLGVEPSTLTRTLEPLVSGGIVDRQMNPDNRREVLIRLSDKGLAVLKEIHEKINHIGSLIIAHIPEKDRENTESSIRLLVNIMKKLEFRHR